MTKLLCYIAVPLAIALAVGSPAHAQTCTTINAVTHENCVKLVKNTDPIPYCEGCKTVQWQWTFRNSCDHSLTLTINYKNNREDHGSDDPWVTSIDKNSDLNGDCDTSGGGPGCGGVTHWTQDCSGSSQSQSRTSKKPQPTSPPSSRPSTTPTGSQACSSFNFKGCMTSCDERLGMNNVLYLYCTGICKKSSENCAAGGVPVDNPYLRDANTAPSEQSGNDGDCIKPFANSSGTFFQNGCKRQVNVAFCLGTNCTLETRTKVNPESSYQVSSHNVPVRFEYCIVPAVPRAGQCVAE